MAAKSNENKKNNNNNKIKKKTKKKRMLQLRLGDISVFSCRYDLVVQRYDYRRFCKKIELSFMHTQPFTVCARIRSSRTWTSNVREERMLFVMAEDDPDMNDTIDLSTESMELDKFAGETIDGSDKFPNVDKAGTKSEIWRYFGLHADKDGKPVNNGTAVCHICHRDVLAKAGNTSNLISHLRLKHPSVYAQSSFITKPSSSKADSHQKGQISIASLFAQSQPYDRKSKKWNSLTKVVTYCIVKDGLPLYTVEKEGFKKMLYKFDPRYEPPSRNYISRIAVPDLYATTKEQVMKKLSKVAYFASTTDMWSSTAGLMPYMSYTVHFINEDWELESLSLGTHFLPEDHTAPILAEAMQSTLVEWKLQSSQQSCLTTDNGTNIVAAARDLSWVRISCFGHNLHLAITKAFD